MLVSCLAYSSTMNMETICSSQTSVDFQRTTTRYIPRGRTLQNHRRENLKSYSLTSSTIRVAGLPPGLKLVLFLGVFFDPEDGGEMFLRNIV
jgi:hypothetical protein